MSHFGFITAIFMGDDALMHATAGLLGLRFWMGKDDIVKTLCGGKVGGFIVHGLGCGGAFANSDHACPKCIEAARKTEV